MNKNMSCSNGSFICLIQTNQILTQPRQNTISSDKRQTRSSAICCRSWSPRGVISFPFASCYSSSDRHKQSVSTPLSFSNPSAKQEKVGKFIRIAQHNGKFNVTLFSFSANVCPKGGRRNNYVHLPARVFISTPEWNRQREEDMCPFWLGMNMLRNMTHSKKQSASIPVWIHSKSAPLWLQKFLFSSFFLCFLSCPLVSIQFQVRTIPCTCSSFAPYHSSTANLEPFTLLTGWVESFRTQFWREAGGIQSARNKVPAGQKH